MMIVSNEV